MHKIRRAAHSQAWYTDGDEPNYNPFSRPRSHRPIQEDDGLRHIQTEGDALDSAEEKRRSQLSPGTMPHHSSTMPVNKTNGVASSSSHVQHSDPINQTMDERKETSGESDPTSETLTQDRSIVEEESQPRKRKGASLMSKMPWKHGKGDNMERVNSSKTSKSKKQKHFGFVPQVKATLFNSWINVLLIMVPVGIAVNYIPSVDRTAVFVINFVAIIPLAALLSYATEEIALRTGEVLGGLLNATFGNAVELIVSIIALFADEIVIVQTSLIGSMLSNLLLVMGMSFFLGGINRLEQNFNTVVAQTATSLLSLAIGSLIIPTVFNQLVTVTPETGAEADQNIVDANKQEHITALSRGTSVLLLLVYAAYLYFQLSTHVEIYNAPSEKSPKRNQKIAKGQASAAMMTGAANVSAGAVNSNVQENMTSANREAEEDVEEPQLSLIGALVTLLAATVLVALCAEFMVHSIDHIVESSKISKTFVGLILVPIVGNAAEHATAVTVAIKDKMDLAIGVAVGSSMQIALLVLPLMIIIGWIAGKPAMNLSFDGFQVAILFVSILLVNYLIADGKSHWLEGVQLMTLYLIIAVAAYFYPNIGDPSQPLGSQPHNN